MEPMAYAEPGGIASAGEYNKVVRNVEELATKTTFTRIATAAQVQPIPSGGGWTRLTFPTGVKSCPHVSVDSASGTFTIITEDGSFDIAAGYRCAGGAGARHIRIAAHDNSSAVYIGTTISGASPNVAIAVSRPGVSLPAGTALSVWAWQDSGASINTSPLGDSVFVAIRYCGES